MSAIKRISALAVAIGAATERESETAGGDATERISEIVWMN